MEQPKKREEKDEYLSFEESEALGFPKGFRVTRKEAGEHADVLRRQGMVQESVASKARQSLGKEMKRQLTDEEIEKAGRAGQEREEQGK